MSVVVSNSTQTPPGQTLLPVASSTQLVPTQPVALSSIQLTYVKWFHNDRAERPDEYLVLVRTSYAETVDAAEESGSVMFRRRLRRSRQIIWDCSSVSCYQRVHHRRDVAWIAGRPRDYMYIRFACCQGATVRIYVFEEAQDKLYKLVMCYPTDGISRSLWIFHRKPQRGEHLTVQELEEGVAQCLVLNLRA